MTMVTLHIAEISKIELNGTQFIEFAVNGVDAPYSVFESRYHISFLKIRGICGWKQFYLRGVESRKSKIKIAGPDATNTVTVCCAYLSDLP